LREKGREPVLVAFHVGRKLDEKRPEAIRGRQRLESIQHELQEVIAFRLETEPMGDLPVDLRGKEKARRRGSEPIGYGFLRRETIPEAVQFNGIVAGRVIPEKSRLLEIRRVKPIRSLPGFVRIT
jgi:hypothetical protein